MIGPEVGFSARAVSAILCRHQVPYLRECDPLTGEQGPTWAAFLLRAAAYVTTFSIVRTKRVMTDNHCSYFKSAVLADAISALGAKHVLIRPHCRWQNGAVERFN